MITSASNKSIKNVQALLSKAKERKKQGVFVVEGPKMSFEAPYDWVSAVYMSESFFNDDRFKEVETTLDFILNKFSNLFPVILSEQERLFILALTIRIVLSTCESALMEDSVIGIDEMKPVLYKIVDRIFR